MRIHAIIIALNEEDFIVETLKPLYSFCSGISVITQYDRDYYGKIVAPDNTVQKVLQFPDPEGKIHLVVRRYNDGTASRNHEMMAILKDASKKVKPHGNAIQSIRNFHKRPDYFLICDADEIYDTKTLPEILKFLEEKKPNGMRVSAYDYYFDWQHRVPRNRYVHHHFGFIKAGLLFEQRRMISWNEFRLNHLAHRLSIKAKIGSWLYGFIDCPMDIGMFHHAGYVRRNREQMLQKLSKHSHLEVHEPGFLDKMYSQDFEFVPRNKLPENITNGVWPQNFFSDK